MITHRSTFALLAPFVWCACSTQDTPDTRVARDSARSSSPTPAIVSIEFDPAATYAGDTIMGLVVDTIAARPTPTGEVVGMARFSGVLTLSGQTFRHPDGDDYAFPCFEADSASARTLPHWAGDTRRPWFCFDNPEYARERLGEAGTGLPATIRVDRFTINRNLSDAVNSARLVEVVSRSATDLASMSCYSSRGSVLGRAAGTAAPAPRSVVGWVQIDDSFAKGADSGTARLVDSDARSLTARWHRVGNDSITIVGFDDFVRVEMRIVATPGRLAGPATARSDAAATRDSAGRLSPWTRSWNLDAGRQPCDSLSQIRAS